MTICACLNNESKLIQFICEFIVTGVCYKWDLYIIS